MRTEKREENSLPNLCIYCELDCPFKMLTLAQRRLTCHVYTSFWLSARDFLKRPAIRPKSNELCYNEVFKGKKRFLYLN
jgi:hypothetical protein